jgi:hypothetical protein
MTRATGASVPAHEVVVQSELVFARCSILSASSRQWWSPRRSTACLTQNGAWVSRTAMSTARFQGTYQCDRIAVHHTRTSALSAYLH